MAKTQMSQEGYNRLKRRHEELVTVRRAEVAQKLKEARGFGDLSENAEYDEAMNEQGILEAEIKELEVALANAEVVDDAEISEDVVGIGVLVTMRRVDTGKTEEFFIVSTSEANMKEHKISDESPIGKAAMQKRVGDRFQVVAPVGELEFEIVDIRKKSAETF